MRGPSPRERGFEGLAWLALLALFAALACQSIRSLDYWWHLRTGFWIAESGSVPRLDPYSYTAAGEPWIDVHWLFQLGLAGLYSLGGHGAVVLGKALAALAVLGLLAPIGYRRERAALSIVPLAALALVLGDRLMPRPELPTFVLLAAAVALLERFRERGDRSVYGLVLVQLVWVNVHGLFAVGLALIGLYVLAELGEWWRARPDPRAGLRLRRIGVAAALALAVSLLNPNGLAGALYPLEQLGMIGPPGARSPLGTLVTELAPTLSPQGATPHLQLLFLAIAAFALSGMLIGWRRVALSDPLVLLAFLYLGLAANRNLPLFAIAAVPLGVRIWNRVLDARPAPLKLPGTANAVLAGLLVLSTLDVASGRYFGRQGELRAPGFGTIESLHPRAAADWILRERPPGPVAHHMADGGYLIWRLFPAYRVMLDGRLEVYGARRLTELNLVSADRLLDLDERYRFGAVLLNLGFDYGDLLEWLLRSARWKLVQVDDSAALFVRADAGSFSPVELTAPGLFPALPEAHSPELPLVAANRARLLAAAGLFERALDVWEEALRARPDLEGGEAMRAWLRERVVPGLGGAR